MFSWLKKKTKQKTNYEFDVFSKPKYWLNLGGLNEDDMEDENNNFFSKPLYAARDLNDVKMQEYSNR